MTEVEGRSPGFNIEYRPDTFDRVHGQVTIVNFMKGLIQRGQLCRNLAIFGPYGAGKTTLVRLYAKALNCIAPVNGSPCNDCRSCHSERPEGYGLFECDVAKGREDVAKWVSEKLSYEIERKRRVLFLDEVHLISKSATAALLKTFEEPPPNVSFCIATTNPAELNSALVSRFDKFRVHTLEPKASVLLLEEIATRAGIAADRNALYLIAGKELGHPRSMLSKLEEIGAEHAHITYAAVKAFYDLEDLDQVRDYFLALSMGDVAGQGQVLSRWTASLRQQVDWIRLFLAATYFSEIRRSPLLTDTLIDAIEERSRIVHQFRSRLRLDRGQLDAFWQRLMDHWQVFEQDHISLQLRLARFEYLANINPSANSGSGRAYVAPSDVTARLQTPPTKSSVNVSDFITLEEVRSVVNAVSFFAQHYGQLMNVSIDIDPFEVLASDDSAAVAAIDAFCLELERRYSGNFGGICVLEREAEGIVGRMAAHASPDSLHLIGGWCEEWNGRNGTGRATCRTAEADDWRFHHRESFRLCAGYEDPDNLADSRQMLRHLQIPEKEFRQPRALAEPVRHFGLLREAAVQSACAYGMEPFSAFDAGRHDVLRARWELKEFKRRNVEIARRRQRVEEIEDSLEGDARRDALAALQQNWLGSAGLNLRPLPWQ
jgi:DNA polymerase III subunit gamma/tau